MVPIPLYGIKFHLQNKLPQAICRHNKKPFARAISVSVGLQKFSSPLLRVHQENF